MRLKKNVSLKDFIDTVKRCQHDVYFESNEGDHLNLKSSISQFVFASAGNDEEYLHQGTIVCESVSDYATLADYIEE